MFSSSTTPSRKTRPWPSRLSPAMNRTAPASSFIITSPRKWSWRKKCARSELRPRRRRPYLTRTFQPKSYTALDLNPAGISFCQQRHRVDGLTFVQGDAEHLPFEADTFDAVINVEASHCYPDFPRFLAEVARVLRPGGHFLYADFRFRRPSGRMGKSPRRRAAENPASTEHQRRSLTRPGPEFPPFTGLDRAASAKIPSCMLGATLPASRVRAFTTP